MNIPAVETGMPPAPLPDAGTAKPVRAEVAFSFTSAAPDAASWNELVARSNGTVYQTHEWQSLWWESFGKGRVLHIVVFRADDLLVGIAPLFTGSGSGVAARTLRFIGSGDAFSRSGGMFNDDGPSDYLDFIVDPAYGDAVGRAFAEHLRKNAGSFGRIDLVNLRWDGPGLKFVVPAIQAAGGLEVSVTPGDACHAIAVASPTPDFIRSLDAGARRRYNQASRILPAGRDIRAGNGADARPGATAVQDRAVTLRSIGPAGWDATYGDLVRLHQARWNRAGFPGLFHDAAGAEFQKRAAAALYARGWLWYGAIYDGATCVAARLGFIFRGRMYDYLSGFDDASAWAKKRPGMALILQMYDDAFSGGVKTLDLLRGDEKYKAELTAVRNVLMNARIRVRSGASRRLFAAASSAAELAGFLLGREVRLLVVQLRQHGAVRGIRSYVRFRTQRFTNKFHIGKDGSTNE